MQTRLFLAHPTDIAAASSLELAPTLHSAPRGDRPPVKILVIGTRDAVTITVHTLHQLRFAETFEWTDFLTAPADHQGFYLCPGEVMKALVKYLPHSYGDRPC